MDLENTMNQSVNYVNDSVANFSNTYDELLGLQRYNNSVAASMAQDQRSWSAQQAQITRDFNAAEAQKNRDWQEEMSNTSYQRQVADLLRAGLNPILAVYKGSGASTPSGSSASASSPSGAAASPDTSIISSFVQLLSSGLKSMTDLASTSTSALANMTNAEKLNEANKVIAQMYTDASRETTKYSSDQAFQSAFISAYLHKLATEYASDNSLLGSYAVSSATKYASDNSLAASKYAADKSYAASKYSTDENIKAKAETPSSWAGLASSLLNSIFANDPSFSSIGVNSLPSALSLLARKFREFKFEKLLPFKDPFASNSNW